MNRDEKPKYAGVVFFVKNVETSKKFYTEILDQKIEMDFGRCIGFEGGFAIWDSAYAKKMIELDENNESDSKRNAELYFEIDSLDAFYERVKRENIEFIHHIKEQPWGQRCFRVYDPDKHIIECSEPMSAVIRHLFRKGLPVDDIVEKTLMPLEVVNEILREK